MRDRVGRKTALDVWPTRCDAPRAPMCCEVHPLARLIAFAQGGRIGCKAKSVGEHRPRGSVGHAAFRRERFGVSDGQAGFRFLVGGPGRLGFAQLDPQDRRNRIRRVPPRILAITLGLPAGTTIGAVNHPTCSSAVLEQTGPSGCTEGSQAGPIGSALSIISFGSGQFEESLTIETFFAPGGGLNLFILGREPVSIEIVARATFSGNVVSIEPPLVSTVPGAPYASFKELPFRLGGTEEQEELDHFTSGVTPLRMSPERDIFLVNGCDLR